MLNAPVAYDLGYRLVGHAREWFILDEMTRQVMVFPDHDNLDTYPAAELAATNWIKARGAKANWLPSQRRFHRTRLYLQFLDQVLAICKKNAATPVYPYCNGELPKGAASFFDLLKSR